MPPVTLQLPTYATPTRTGPLGVQFSAMGDGVITIRSTREKTLLVPSNNRILTFPTISIKGGAIIDHMPPRERRLVAVEK